MMNLIFNNVPHQSGEKKSINLTIDYCMVTWNVIFEFLMERTDFREKKFKISVKNNYYTLNELLEKSSFYETFEYDEFINFNVKLYSNPVIKQIEILLQDHHQEPHYHSRAQKNFILNMTYEILNPEKNQIDLEREYYVSNFFSYFSLNVSNFNSQKYSRIF